MRLYELAKEYKVKSVDLVEWARQDWGLSVRSYMDVLGKDLETQLRKQLDKRNKSLKELATESKTSTKKTVKRKPKTASVIKKVAKPNEVATDKESVTPKVSVKKTSSVIRRKAADVKIQPVDLEETTKPKPAVQKRETQKPMAVGTLKEDLNLAIDTDLMKEEEKKRIKKTSDKEVQSKKFVAADFRKREVIFQPKKKRVIQDRNVKKTQITIPKSHKRVVYFYQGMSVQDLSHKMGVKTIQLIDKLKKEGVSAEATEEIDFDTATLVATDFNFEVKNQEQTFADFVKEQRSGDLKAEAVVRPPVVTVMGHVDHGKTTLLDKIRSSKVAQGEAGGITQHVGAYNVSTGSTSITFIDTPGHEAFTEMRARGARITDIIIIVVAADDGVSAQTKEAIKHAQSAQAPILVAVNKIDKAGADPEKVKKQMSEQGLLPEEWGGDTIFVPISALNGEGIKELLEQISLLAEMQELKANPKQSAEGVVIESRMEKGKGWVSTFIVQNGTLKSSQYVMTETVVGRVRQMTNDQGQIEKAVSPGIPIEVSGFENPPVVGEFFCVVQNEKKARDFLEEYKSRNQSKTKVKTLEDLFKEQEEKKKKVLNVIIKADVAGSLEAIKSSVSQIYSDEVKVNIVDSGLGAISDSDVLLASTAGAELVGFNVRFDSKTERLAKEHQIMMQTYTVIYELLDAVKKRAIGTLDPDIVEEKGGVAEVKEVFSITGVGAIAGSMVKEGKILRTHEARLVRDGVIVYDGKISSLKRFKDDVKEVGENLECGIGLHNFNDIKPGDLIESYAKKEVPKKEL